MGGPGSIEIRPNSIRITFTVDGRRMKKTLVAAGGGPLPPTAGNIKYAHRMAKEIASKIRLGLFSMAEYFPTEAEADDAATVGKRIKLWLELQTGLANSTLRSYRIAADWWISQLGEKPVGSIVHSDILRALASRPDWSGKTRNNKVSVLRQALQLARRDGVIEADPLDGLEASSHQSPEPDPFTVAEVDLIIGEMRDRYGPGIAAYFEFKFFTGLRTSESLAVRWEHVDWPSRTIQISEAIVMGEHLKRTKTKTVRQVQLNTRALAVLTAQKALTFMLKEGWIFVDPRTSKRWADDWYPRRMLWEPTLKKLGLRHRSPYQTRHTYATMLLMAGVTPAYAARQMGHSVQMFLKTYARWIDGGMNQLEMDKLEALISGNRQASIQKEA